MITSKVILTTLDAVHILILIYLGLF